MTIQLFDCAQNTPEWHDCRKGIPTASKYGVVLMEGKTKGSPSVTRRKYINSLVCERISGKVDMEGYKSVAMDRGHVLETPARDIYAFLTGYTVERVGFIRNGTTGCSPDGLVGADGMVQIKTMKPELFLDAVDDGVMPSEHIPQVQGEMMVAERKWNDFVLYCDGMKPLIVRVNRDDNYILTLRAELSIFNQELDAREARERAR